MSQDVINQIKFGNEALNKKATKRTFMLTLSLSLMWIIESFINLGVRQ